MPGPQKPLDFGSLQTSLGRLALETGMHRRDERSIPMLKHVDRQSSGEDLRGGVDVADNFVATPPPNEADSVRIHLGQYESHGTSLVEGSGTYVGVREPDG